MEESSRFVTDADSCPYLPDRQWQLEFWYRFAVSPNEHEAELARGARRFGCAYFRPVCDGCRECTPVRVPVRDFEPSRSQRRVLRRNQDVELAVGEPGIDAERLDLYRRFHEQKAVLRGWPRKDVDALEYLESFVQNAVLTHEFRYSMAGKLVAVAYVDESSRALSSQYAFYDPDFEDRSLGTYDVLKEISVAQERGKDYLYLGYYVRDCSSMEYKARFRPHEMLVDGEWILDDAPRRDG